MGIAPETENAIAGGAGMILISLLAVFWWVSRGHDGRAAEAAPVAQPPAQAVAVPVQAPAPPPTAGAVCSRSRPTGRPTGPCARTCATSTTRPAM